MRCGAWGECVGARISAGFLVGIQLAMWFQHAAAVDIDLTAQVEHDMALGNELIDESGSLGGTVAGSPVDRTTPYVERLHGGRLIVDVGFHAQQLVGASDVWGDPKLGLTFNIATELGNVHPKEVAYSCKSILIPQSDSQAYHITSLAPYVARTARGATLVHHMDIFFCDASIVTQSVSNKECVMYENNPNCYPLVWAYDKGAFEPYSTPPDVGFAVGKGTPFRAIGLQVHYLMPRTESTAQLLAERFIDVSGVRLTLTSRVRPINAGTVSWMGASMRIPPGAASIRHVSHFPKGKMEELFERDFAAAPGGVLTMHDVHMHAHAHAKKLTFAITRAGMSVEEALVTLDPYCGEGSCQHFVRIPLGARQELRRGDALSLICEFHNEEGLPLIYGVGWNQEMCGALLIYSPHVTPHDASEVGDSDGETSFWDERSTEQAPGGEPHIADSRGVPGLILPRDEERG